MALDLPLRLDFQDEPSRTRWTCPIGASRRTSLPSSHHVSLSLSLSLSPRTYSLPFILCIPLSFPFSILHRSSCAHVCIGYTGRRTRVVSFLSHPSLSAKPNPPSVPSVALLFRTIFFLFSLVFPFYFLFSFLVWLVPWPVSPCTGTNRNFRGRWRARKAQQVEPELKGVSRKNIGN